MLFCFDIDGTLQNIKMKGEGEYVEGIIPVRTLLDLILDEHKVAIVSPSPFYPEGFESMIYARNESNDYRWENIKDAMKFNNEKPETTVYIDDLEGNLKQINKVFPEIETFTPQGFLDQLSQ